MIDGVFFLASCVAIGLLVIWIVQNDHVRPGDRTIGFFAMLSGDSKDPAKTGMRKPGKMRRLSREG